MYLGGKTIFPSITIIVLTYLYSITHIKEWIPFFYLRDLSHIDIGHGKVYNGLRHGDEIKVSKTTTVGLVIKDYVVLAADKRATAGLYISHKKVEKIHKVTDYMAMTISGLVADAQVLVDEAKAIAKQYELLTGVKPSVKSIATYLSNILSSYLRLVPFIVQLLVGGYDTRPRLYYVDLFGTLSEEKYMATGSGSPTAFGVLEKEYREDMSLDEAKELAKSAVKAALERDAWSGEGIDIVVIGKDLYKKETYLFKG